jgi:hypothetical protein
MVKIGEMLVAVSACPPEAVRQALHNQNFFGGRLGTNLLELGAVEEEKLAYALGRLFRLPSAWGAVLPDPRAISLVPRQLIDRFEVVPYAVDGRTLRLLVSDPTDLRAIDEISFAIGKAVKPIIAPEARVWTLMREHYGIERRLRGGGDLQRRWAPRLQGRQSIARPLADDVW